jgi:hypothetical protein
MMHGETHLGTVPSSDIPNSLSAGTESKVITQKFTNHRDAALALLSGGYRLTRKSGSFLGQLVADPSALSDAQAQWLAKLLEKNGLNGLAPR